MTTGGVGLRVNDDDYQLASPFQRSSGWYSRITQWC